LTRRKVTLNEFFKERSGVHQQGVRAESRSLIEIMVRQVGVGLVDAFNNWLDTNKDVINPKLYDKLKRELRKANTTTIPGVVGLALWMFGVVNNVGCRMMFGPYGYRIVSCDGYDRNATERLAAMIHTALGLQALAPAMASQDDTSPP
jgi:hypothetical protein